MQELPSPHATALAYFRQFIKKLVKRSLFAQHQVWCISHRVSLMSFERFKRIRDKIIFVSVHVVILVLRQGADRLPCSTTRAWNHLC